MSEQMSHKCPLVSVIIPTRDRCGLLLETLASVQNQTYQRWEAVVVDDLSDDNTWPVLLDLAARDPRIRPLRRTGAVGGGPVARNQGFTASRGAFIVFLDSDDLLTPTALDRRVRMALAHPAADAVVFQAEHFTGAPGQHTGEAAYRIHALNGADPLDAFLADHVLPWCTSGALWRRAAVERAGPWDIRLPFNQDAEYHVRALIAGICFERFTEVDQYIRNRRGPRFYQQDNPYVISKRVALLDDIIAQLRAQGMLTVRRRRMLAWSAFWGAVGNTFQRPRPAVSEELNLWRAARERSLCGRRAYLAGSLIIVSQCLRVVGPVFRELARPALYNDLKNQPLFHPEFLRTLYYLLRWRIPEKSRRISQLIGGTLGMAHR